MLVPLTVSVWRFNTRAAFSQVLLVNDGLKAYHEFLQLLPGGLGHATHGLGGDELSLKVVDLHQHVLQLSGEALGLASIRTLHRYNYNNN